MRASGNRPVLGCLTDKGLSLLVRQILERANERLLHCIGRSIGVAAQSSGVSPELGPVPLNQNSEILDLASENPSDEFAVGER